MTKEYEQRARIIQQAMESCHSNNPIDCIEWLADKISKLEKENANLKVLRKYEVNVANLEIEKLEAQIVKMKNYLSKHKDCKSCKNNQFILAHQQYECVSSPVCKWEIKEND